MIWIYFTTFLDLQPFTNGSWRSYLLHIWCSAPATFLGAMQTIFPGVLLWNIQKMYASILFDDHSRSLRLTIRSICMDLYTWTSSTAGTIINTTIPQLVAARLSPPL